MLTATQTGQTDSWLVPISATISATTSELGTTSETNASDFRKLRISADGDRPRPRAPG